MARRPRSTRGWAPASWSPPTRCRHAPAHRDDGTSENAGGRGGEDARSRERARRWAPRSPPGRIGIMALVALLALLTTTASPTPAAERDGLALHLSFQASEPCDCLERWLQLFAGQRDEIRLAALSA